ncbi:MAG TPA: VanZ family protein [Arenimonas sp.]|nr:VanZ family protein [Arenimonas sp.]
MSDLRWRRFWLGLWIFGMLLGLYLSLRRGGDEMPPIPHLDKLIHATGYAILASLAVCLFEKPGPRWRALLWVILLGGLIEIAQGLLPTGRMMEAADFAANTLGAGIGAALFWRRNALVFAERVLSKG